MLRLRAKQLYIDPKVYEKPNCRARLNRMLPFITARETLELTEGARLRLAEITQRRHGKDDFGDDGVIVFDTFEEARRNWYYHFRDAAAIRETRGVICQSANELNIIKGCAFRCAYCGFGRLVIFPLDIERWLEEAEPVIRDSGDQTLFKYSNMSDLPCFEPEYGAVEPMVRRFAREPRKYLMLFTKSENVDFLLDLPHCGRTIISWSLSTHPPSRVIDRRTATMEQRIEAARRAQEAGYIPRMRLSPIVPVRDWRREATEMLELLFSRVKPDLITLHMLGWFDAEDLPKILDIDLLDPAIVRRVQESAEEMKGKHNAPFPPDVREDIYSYYISEVKRISPRTPVSICLETEEMWQRLGERIGMSPSNYICNCGPTSTPPNPLFG